MLLRRGATPALSRLRLLKRDSASGTQSVSLLEAVAEPGQLEEEEIYELSVVELIDDRWHKFDEGFDPEA